jgi:hypothetical protein
LQGFFSLLIILTACGAHAYRQLAQSKKQLRLQQYMHAVNFETFSSQLSLAKVCNSQPTGQICTMEQIKLTEIIKYLVPQELLEHLRNGALKAGLLHPAAVHNNEKKTISGLCTKKAIIIHHHAYKKAGPL